ncbi:MAG: cation:dicarboxylase symporter family transporter [Muribaculum sp.]|nr:cation:dicarboxylase symporter family transporter [Muribaculum sp.]
MKLFIKIMKSPFTLLLSIIAGFLTAIYGKAIVPYLAPINVIYINLLQMCVLPIVSCAVAVNIGALFHENCKGLFKRWAAAVMVMLLFSAGLAVCLSLTFRDSIRPDQETKQAVTKLQGTNDEESSFFTEVSYYEDEAEEITQEEFQVIDFLINAIPTNIFVSFVNNDTLKVLLFFGLFGIMLALIDERKAGAVQKGMEGIYQAFCRLVDIILIFLPLSMYTMIAVQFQTEGMTGIVTALFKVVLLIYLILFVVVAVSFCVIQKRTGCSVKEHIRAIKRTFFVAVGTSSCIATVSVAMDDVPEHLHLDKQVSRSVMPIGITVFQNGVIICAAVAAVFGTTIYDVNINLNTVMIILMGAIMYSFSIVGIPGIVAVSMLDMILSPLGIPSEVIVLIYLAIIPVIDPFSVFTSVYSNIAVTTVVNHKESAERKKGKLGKRLFAAAMGISAAAVIIVSGIAIWQFADTKGLIITTKQEENDALYETNVDIMTDTSKESVRVLAVSYAEGINGNIEAIETSVRLTAENIGDLYGREAVGASRFGDSMVYLQPDVSMEEVETEFMQVRGARDLIDNVAQAFDKASALYYVSESGMLLSNVEVDYEHIAGEEIDRRTRDWYQGAAGEGDIHWTEVYQDALSGKSTLTCSCPVYDRAGTLKGVVAYDIYLESLCDAIFANSSDLFEYSFITDKEGRQLAGAGEREASGLDAEVREIVMKEKEAAVEIYPDKKLVLGYAGIQMNGWNLFVLMDYDAITAPADHVGEAITESNNAFLAFIDWKMRSVFIAFIIITLCMIAAVSVVTSRITRSIVRPVEQLTEGVRRISAGNLEHQLAVRADGEIGELTDAFNKMTVDLKDYIHNLERVTAEKERIGTELNVAAQIQADMLPCTFPAFPDRQEIDIYATMSPAKEVGGDFYDFFMVDERHLAMVIADVSGKGVPAALFMVIGKTLIKDHTQPGRDLGEVFSEVNQLLCESNQEGLFITAFEGVLDLVTGEFVYVNAGHEIPFICRKDGVFAPYVIAPGFVLAGLAEMKYKCGCIQLKPGDKVFQYTDGVTEATNQENKLYGMTRLGNVLERNAALPPKELLAVVKEDIDAFVGDMPQFDDITMICLEYREEMGDMGE